jgi:hypothetical protein
LPGKWPGLPGATGRGPMGEALGAVSQGKQMRRTNIQRENAKTQRAAKNNVEKPFDSKEKKPVSLFDGSNFVPVFFASSRLCVGCAFFSNRSAA